jgi:hypothetical protein
MALDVNNSMIHGVAPVLEALKHFEPELYKQITKEIKGTAKPLRDKVAAGFPNEPWQSRRGVQWTLYGRTARGKSVDGVGAQFPKYNGAKARRGVTTVVGGRKVQRTNSYPIVRIRQNDAGGQIYDLSKNNRTNKKESFVGNLNKNGEPSRVMWKRTRQYFPMIESNLNKIVDGVANRFTAEIGAETHRRNQASIRASQQTRNVLGQFGKALR